MKKVKKIFVGTLHSGEQEFEQSKKMIALQEGVTVKHHIISGLPEAEAHQTLWDDWSQSKEDFDLFVKIDADTVLNGPDALEKVAKLFCDNPDATGAQIPLSDYYSDKLIIGLNCFTPEVVFNRVHSKMNPDRVDSNHRIILRGGDVSSVSPIGRHGLDPCPRQAFFFGYHRAIKKQKSILTDVSQAYTKLGGSGRLYALAGAMSVYFFSQPLDYFSPAFDRKFKKALNNVNLERNVNKFAKSLMGSDKR